MTTEEKYKLLMGGLKKMRVAFGPEKAKDTIGIAKQAIKGWSAFCIFFDVYVKAEEREG